MDTTYDVAVVGAGIVGLAHAAAAHAAGRSVVVVERAARPAGATVRNFGHIGVSLQTGEAREHAERSRELLISLAQRAGFWLGRRGTLMVATADDEMQVLREAGEGRMLTAREVGDLAPVRGAVGGTLLKNDMQVNPREAGPAIARWLAAEGVDFRWRTSALSAEQGILHTARGEIRAAAIVFCTGADLDHVLPDLAEREGIVRCALDMALVDAVGLEFPLMTGSSMLRYPLFTRTAAHADLRARFETERPDMLERDVHQTYAEAPGLGLFVGDTHRFDATPPPFQDERSYDLLARITRDMFDLGRLPVRERWQGVYAKGRRPFVTERVAEGVHATIIAAGSGMTTSLGLGEAVMRDVLG